MSRFTNECAIERAVTVIIMALCRPTYVILSYFMYFKALEAALSVDTLGFKKLITA